MCSFVIFSSLRFDSFFLDSLCALCWNALAKACPFNLGSLCVGVMLFGPVSPGFWPEGVGSVVGPLLNYDGVLPKDERNKAALHLMSWCTFRMSNLLRELLARLGDACAQSDTEDRDLVLLASRHGAMVETAGELKAWLTGQLHCWVGQHYLQNYQGVVFFFLRLPYGQYGLVSQLSRSEESCTGPFNWGEAHCAGEKVKRKIGPFQWKSL